MNNQIQNEPKKMNFMNFMTAPVVTNKVNEIIGSEKGTSFVTSIVSAVNQNPALSECDHMSIFTGALLGASLNLSPSPIMGQYYLVPFNDKERGKIAQFQIGYKGYIQLAIRTGQYKKLNVIAIKEGELQYYNALNEEIGVLLIEDEIIREQTKTTGYYAMFEYMNGFKKSIYWNTSKMKNHAKKYSQSYANDLRKNTEYSFWSKDFDGMAFKTMLRQLISKWGIMSTEMQKAFETDMTVEDKNGKHQYVDNNFLETKIERGVDKEIINQEEPNEIIENTIDNLNINDL